MDPEAAARESAAVPWVMSRPTQPLWSALRDGEAADRAIRAGELDAKLAELYAMAKAHDASRERLQTIRDRMAELAVEEPAEPAPTEHPPVASFKGFKNKG